MTNWVHVWKYGPTHYLNPDYWWTGFLAWTIPFALMIVIIIAVWYFGNRNRI